MITELCLGKTFNKDPYSFFEIPIYPDAYDIKKYVNNPIGSKSVFYKVNTKFPASEIISFYNKQFRKMELIPYFEDGYGIRKWENFNPKTGKWEKTSSVPARFIATWTDKKKTLRVVLLLRYKYNAKDKEWDKKLFVNCTIYKFFDFRKIQKLLKK